MSVYEIPNALAAFEAIRRGNFEQALGIADQLIQRDELDFWAWYLGALALGYSDNRPSFLHYLEKAESINPESSYIKYLSAYAALWDDDVEKALWQWTHLVDQENGWFAEELIEKARKKSTLANLAKEGRIHDFVILPDMLKEIGEESKLHSDQFEKKEKKKSELRFKHWRFSIGVASILFLLFTVLYFFSNKSIEKKTSPTKNLEAINIDEWAQLIHVEDAKHKYTNRIELIKDFSTARTLLKKHKVNQSRYLLQKIILSNADFKSKEKAQFLLRFIPEIDYQDFADPVNPDQIINDPETYQNSIVLWEAKVIRSRKVDRGQIVSAIVSYKNADYMTEAFLPTKEIESSWLPYEKYKDKQKDEKEKQKAILFGHFKSLIGTPKVIYIELSTLWF